MNSLLGDILGSILRHLLTALGGYLVAKGIASQAQANSLTNDVVAIAPGIVAFLIGQAWSVRRKIQFRAKK